MIPLQLNDPYPDPYTKALETTIWSIQKRSPVKPKTVTKLGFRLPRDLPSPKPISAEFSSPLACEGSNFHSKLHEKYKWKQVRLSGNRNKENEIPEILNFLKTECFRSSSSINIRLDAPPWPQEQPNSDGNFIRPGSPPEAAHERPLRESARAPLHKSIMKPEKRIIGFIIEPENLL